MLVSSNEKGPPAASSVVFHRAIVGRIPSLAKVQVTLLPGMAKPPLVIGTGWLVASTHRSVDVYLPLLEPGIVSATVTRLPGVGVAVATVAGSVQEPGLPSEVDVALPGAAVAPLMTRSALSPLTPLTHVLRTITPRR